MRLSCITQEGVAKLRKKLVHKINGVTAAVLPEDYEMLAPHPPDSANYLDVNATLMSIQSGALDAGNSLTGITYSK